MGPPESKKPRRRVAANKAVNITDPAEKIPEYDGKEAGLEANGDSVFDPCAEMLIHDFDDERTLDEEEALGNNEDPQAELSSLQKEGDMPLSELLAMYGYNGEGNGDNDSGSEQTDPAPVPVVVGSRNSGSDHNTSVDLIEQVQVSKPSKLIELYPDQPTLTRNRFLRSGSRPQSEEEDDDGDYSPDEEEWKKTIMVGSDYQAKVPGGLFKYDDALPYENNDKILWNPSTIPESETVGFLAKTQHPAIPHMHTKDDEQALFLLVQCGYNVDEALRRRRISCVPTADSMSIWSEEECRNFETGMRLYGKDFYTIQKTKVRTRSVGELVQFYYFWKKTERHDVYAHKSRLEKKKFSLYPGITDYMDRFLEEQQVGANVNVLMFSDNKRYDPPAESIPNSDDASTRAHPTYPTTANSST